MPPESTAEELIADYIKRRDWINAEQKRFDEFLKPYNEKMQEIEGKLLSMLNALGTGDKGSLATAAGTAFKTTKMTPSIDPEAPGYKDAVGREALLDFALDNWETVGNELLLIRPQVDAVKVYMQENNGAPPPGVKVSYYSTVNIRRS